MREAAQLERVARSTRDLDGDKRTCGGLVAHVVEVVRREQPARQRVPQQSTKFPPFPVRDGKPRDQDGQLRPPVAR